MPCGKRSVHSAAVVMMTTVDGMHPAFSGRRPKLILISDLYRHLTEIAEVHVRYTPITLSCGTCSTFIVTIQQPLPHNIQTSTAHLTTF